MKSKKVALVTGASGLIGSEICRKYLAEGYTVIGLDRAPRKDLQHPDYQYVKCDLAKEADIKKAIGKLDRLDVAINNAAATNLLFTKFEDITLKMWNDGLAVNLTSCFLIAKYAYPLLKKTKGSLINIASTRHLMSEPNTAIYSAGKGGVVSFTHSLAVTWNNEVRVNCISPGWIDDPKKKLKAKDHSQHPVGRVGVPSDIAEMSFFLTSEAAGFITGQDFVVDGGMTKKMIYE